MVSLQSNKSLTKTACPPGLWTQLQSKTKMQSLTFLKSLLSFTPVLSRRTRLLNVPWPHIVNKFSPTETEISKESKAEGLVDATLVVNYEINQSSQKIAIFDLG